MKKRKKKNDELATKDWPRFKNFLKSNRIKGEDNEADAFIN